jgi:hypothetical protein
MTEQVLTGNPDKAAGLQDRDRYQLQRKDQAIPGDENKKLK